MGPKVTEITYDGPFSRYQVDFQLTQCDIRNRILWRLPYLRALNHGVLHQLRISADHPRCSVALASTAICYLVPRHLEISNHWNPRYRFLANKAPRPFFQTTSLAVQLYHWRYRKDGHCVTHNSLWCQKSSSVASQKSTSKLFRCTCFECRFLFFHHEPPKL